MKKIYIILFAYATCWYSCKEEGNIYYLDPNAPAPKQVSDLNVKNTPGGAIIAYKIPDDENLSYVEAVYEIQPGVFREARSSYYTDTLKLEGFGEARSYQIKIYSVGRNEKKSDPLLLEVNPLTPPVKTVFETLTLGATFGGVTVTFTNDTQAKLAIFVLADDTTKQKPWVPVAAFYSAAVDGEFSARGLDPKEREFAVYIRDRWGNKSDTLTMKLTPLYEEQIPKFPFKALHLPGDFWEGLSATSLVERIWDGVANGMDCFIAKDRVTLPQWFTVDMNQTVIFSRMKIFQRTNYPYNEAWVKTFEIWGSNNPDADGGWDNWELLGKFDSRTPSGSVWPNYTADDMVYQRAGEDFTFDQPLPAVRYMRFKVLDNYGGANPYQLCEFTFWGQIVQ